MKDVWHVITGVYPPQPGGVSDYTALLAAGLAADGSDVHVWAPPAEGITPVTHGVTIHRHAGRWSRSDLTRLDGALGSFKAPRRLLVQYVPNAWGYRGLNFHFCRWMVHRRDRGDDIRLMVHEPFYPWRLRDKPTRWLLAAGQRWMIRKLLSASSQVYLSIPAWEKLLRSYETGDERQMTWLPIPSTIPVIADPVRRVELRRRVASEGQIIIGSFGTFGGAIGKIMAQALPPLLVNYPERVGLLLGRGGDRLAAELLISYPELADRLIAPGGLDPEAVSLNLQICDVLIQPYPDGVSSRRTSVMAGLSHGLPIVTTQGFLSEPVWAEAGCVVLAPAADSRALIRATESLLADAERRASLGRCAYAFYTEYFNVRHTVERILRP